MTTTNGANNDHARAISLLTEAAEGLSAFDTAWLQRHLADCKECARYSELQQAVSSALKSVAAVASPRLIATTQATLRIRAAELHERQSRTMLLSLSVILGVITSLVWGFGLWRLRYWLQESYQLSTFSATQSVWLLWVLMLSPASLAAAYYMLVKRQGKGTLAER